MSGAEGPPASSLLLYQTEDGRTRVECRFADDTLWLAAHQVMSKQALNSERIRARMLATLLGPGELWEALRDRPEARGQHVPG